MSINKRQILENNCLHYGIEKYSRGYRHIGRHKSEIIEPITKWQNGNLLKPLLLHLQINHHFPASHAKIMVLESYANINALAMLWFPQEKNNYDRAKVCN